MSPVSRVSRFRRRSAIPVVALAAITTCGLFTAPAVSAPAVTPYPGLQAAQQQSRASSVNGGSVNSWVPTGAMSVARAGQTATLLPNKMVLVAGGGSARAELYNPGTGAFTPTGRMAFARTDATATLLPDGQVLVAGGCCHGSAQLSSAELYDPESGTWSATGSMNVARSSNVAVLLADGDVLVAGGGCNGHSYGCDEGSYLGTLRSTELYDPSTGTWTLTGDMAAGREYFAGVLLHDGRVLVTGGFNHCDDDLCSDLKSVELYDPATGRWSPAAPLTHSVEQQTATVLGDGKVLVAGGARQAGGNAQNSPIMRAEVYDPRSNSWALTPSMPRGSYGGSATLLANGWVLVAGGGTRVAQIFEPTRDVWVLPGAMSTLRTNATSTVLADGHVLVTGGLGPDGRAQATAEVFRAGRSPIVSIHPTSVTFPSQLVDSPSKPLSFTVVNNGDADLTVSGVSVSGTHPGDFGATSRCSRRDVPPGGSCLVSVGFTPSAIGRRTALVGLTDNAPASPQRVPVSGYGNGPYSWVPTGAMSQRRDDATATRLSDGKVLVAGGESSPTTFLSAAELYDPTSGAFSPTGALDVPRESATAVRLHSGEVLVAGGVSTNFVRLSSAELYDPATGTWSMTGAMHDAGNGLTSTLLNNGKVLVTGLGFSNKAEVYNPATGTWKDTGPMGGGGLFNAAALLNDGRVLVVDGGSNEAELYDPATNQWTATGTLSVARQGPTATLLPDGQVLVAGGAIPNAGGSLASAELYDPATGTWTLADSMQHARYGQTATLMGNGWVVVTGGCSGECGRTTIVSDAEAYDTSTGYWLDNLPMVKGRFGANATLLSDGRLLVTGGSNYCCSYYDTAEAFTVPLLTATPDSGPVGQQVTLRGSGFFASERVRLTWDVFTPLGTARTGSRGGFRTVVTVPADGLGRHTIQATGAASFARGSTTFTVTAPG